MAIPLDRAFLFSFRSQRLHGADSRREFQRSIDLAGLVLAALSRQCRGARSSVPDGDLAVPAFLRAICSRGRVHWFLRLAHALCSAALSGKWRRQIPLYVIGRPDHPFCRQRNRLYLQRGTPGIPGASLPCASDSKILDGSRDFLPGIHHSPGS